MSYDAATQSERANIPDQTSDLPLPPSEINNARSINSPYKPGTQYNKNLQGYDNNSMNQAGSPHQQELSSNRFPQQSSTSGIQEPVYSNLYAGSSQRIGNRLPEHTKSLNNQSHGIDNRASDSSYPPYSHDTNTGNQYSSPGKRDLPQMIPQGQLIGSTQAVQAPYSAQMDKLSGK